MRLSLAILVGRTVSFLSRLLGRGFGQTWSGHLALKIYPSLISKLEGRLERGSIVVAGTNGKTTTCKMIREIFEAAGLSVAHNATGANLLNGVAGALIADVDITRLNRGNPFKRVTPIWRPTRGVGVFELDENALSLVLEQFTPKVVVILNLFRDQLDRYAELELTAAKWRDALRSLPSSTIVILNADDPLVASLGKDLKCQVVYFGVSAPNHVGFRVGEDTLDSGHCSRCGAVLNYGQLKSVSGLKGQTSPLSGAKGLTPNLRFYSHLGEWSCLGCGLQRPKLNWEAKNIKPRDKGGYEFSLVGADSPVPSFLKVTTPLSGLYSISNLLAVLAAASAMEIDLTAATKVLEAFKPAFGRQEEFEKDGKKVRLLLSKNPTGMNENLKIVGESSGPLLFLLNDRIPDGRDTSWVWDIDAGLLREACQGRTVWVGGTRAADMAVRINYAVGSQDFVKPDNVSADLKSVLNKALRQAQGKLDVVQILPTYSAMLEVRKLL